MAERTVQDLLQRIAQMEEHVLPEKRSETLAHVLRRQRTAPELRSQHQELQEHAEALCRLHW